MTDLEGGPTLVGGLPELAPSMSPDIMYPPPLFDFPPGKVRRKSDSKGRLEK